MAKDLSDLEYQATKALAAFAADLESFRINCGAPSMRWLAKGHKQHAGMSPSNLSEVLNGKRLPSLDVTIRMVCAMAGHTAGFVAQQVGSWQSTDDLVAYWRSRWTEVKGLQSQVDKLSRRARATAGGAPGDLHSFEESVTEGPVDQTSGVASAIDGLISAASVVRAYGVQIVPGLLQCPEYVRAGVWANRHQSQAELERQVYERLRRQDVLNRPGAPTFWAVLDETTLHRSMGGAESMRPQIEYLIEKADQPNITIQLLPFSVGAHAAATSAFTLLRFAEVELSDIVCLEHLIGVQYLDRPEDVEQYILMMDRVANDALTPEGTLKALKRFAMLSSRRLR